MDEQGPQPGFSEPIPGPQPGFVPEHEDVSSQSNVHFTQQTNYVHATGRGNYDQFNQQGNVHQAGGSPVTGPPVGGSPVPGPHVGGSPVPGPRVGGSPVPGPHVEPQIPAPRPAPITAPQYPRPGFNVPWTTGLFSCCDDPVNAVITFFVPCVTFGQVAEIIDQGSSSCATHAIIYSCIWFCICCPCLLSCAYRTRLRARYELMESPAPDCLTHFFCETCALCQMHRELVNRGIDPSIGWLANVQRMQQQQMQPMVAPAHQAMM